MKSLLHIGINAPSHSPKGMEKGFREAGFTEYHFFDWQAVRYNEGILGCQSRMVAAANQIKPDLIFCQFQNSDICDPETAVALSLCGFTVNYSFDVRSMELTEWMYDLADAFGLTLFACQEDVDEAKRRGINNVGYLHSSCDTDQYRPLQLSEEEKSKYPEIVFIGNNYVNTNLGFPNSQERVEMVNFMRAEFGDRFGVYGMGWEPGSKMVNVIEEVNIYNSCKIVICHNNYTRTKYCSDRQWRATACKTPTIIHHYIGFEDDFKTSFLTYWKKFDDLKWIVRRLLEDPAETKDVARRQYDSFSKQHTWKHRIYELLHLIEVEKYAKYYGHNTTG